MLQPRRRRRTTPQRNSSNLTRNRDTLISCIAPRLTLTAALCATALLVMALSLCAAAPALAVPPAIEVADQEDGHVAVSFSAPRADLVSVSIASEPDRGTDGRFLSENVVTMDFFTDSEIQSGLWFDSDRIDPGSYFVMLNATRDFTTCDRYDSNYNTVIDPSCADGFSTVEPLTIPTPKTKYAVKTDVLKNIRIAYLTLTGTPLGTERHYQVCWKQPSGKEKTLKKKCVTGTLSGYSWSSDASDLLRISTKGMTKRTKFTWYTRGSSPKVLASKTITIS